MATTDIYNYRLFSDTIATAGLPSEFQLHDAKHEGFSAIINLLPDDSPYAVPGEAAIVNALGLEYFYIPVEFENPTLLDFEKFERALASTTGKKVLIHCAANYRVSAFMSIYAKTKLGWDNQTFETYRNAIWQPDEIWAAFIKKMMR